MATTSSITATWSAGSGGTPDTYDFRWRLAGTTTWTEVDGLVVTSYTVSGLPQGTSVEWQVRAVNGSGTSDWSDTTTCTTLSQYTFLSCANGWTLSAPTVQVYGLDHLIGMSVVGLLDGVVMTSQVVADDGSVTLPFAASNWKIGLAFAAQLQTPYLEAGSPTVQGRRKNIPAVTIRVDSSAGMEVGTNQPDGAAQVPAALAPAWTNMVENPIQNPGTYTTTGGATVTKLATGDIRITAPAQWAKPGQIAVQQTQPLPLNVTAVVPEVLEGDTIEQGYSQRQDGQHQSRPPGNWMLR